jgi:uncharacterized protein (DUF1330 family)
MATSVHRACCQSAWQPNPGRGSTYRSGKTVRTSGATSDGRFIARGGRTYVVNGAPPKRVATIQWESFERAKAFYESNEYKRVIPIRDKSSNFRAYVIEGVAK